MLASQTGHRNTLLLDGASNDWATATTFQCPTDRGVADMILQGKLIDDVLRPVEGANLLVGSLRGENSPSLSAASAHTVYGALRARFELTVIDCPSINTGRYPDIVPEASDGIVLIVQAEKNRPEVVQHAKGLVEQAGGTFVAAVLNRRRIYIPRMLYNLM